MALWAAGIKQYHCKTCFLTSKEASWGWVNMHSSCKIGSRERLTLNHSTGPDGSISQDWLGGSQTEYITTQDSLKPI